MDNDDDDYYGLNKISSSYSNYSYDYEPYEDQIYSNSLQKKNSFNVYKEDDTNKLREETIAYALNKVQLERDNLILALIYYKWDADNLGDGFYDDPDKNSHNAGIELSPKAIKELEKAGVKSHNDACSICMTSSKELDKNDFYGLSCYHNFCKDCWLEYLTERLNEINSVVFTPCPQFGCNCIVTESVFLKTLKGLPNLLKLYQRAYLRNFTEFNSIMKSCPSPGCDTFISCHKKGSCEVSCLYCECTFCFKCLRDGHSPCSCELISAWDNKNKDESENVKWLEVNTKKCPACHRHIEKNQGCNHMTCRKEAGGCGHEFCWLCFADWKGHTNCNNYDESKDKKKTEDLKHELDKYIFYFNRYMIHKKSLAYALKTQKALEGYLDILNTTKNISYNDLQFMKEGTLCAIRSKRILMNSYVFGFYIKDDNGPPVKPLFEYHQGMLESNADKIQGFLENNSIDALVAIENFDEFNHNFKIFKNSLIGLYTTTNKFCNDFLNEAENNLLSKICFKK